MDKLINQIHCVFLKFRVCACCGSFLNSKAQEERCLGILCYYCSAALQQSALKNIVGGYNMKVFSLYDWRDKNYLLASKIIRAFKCGGPEELFYSVAEKMIIHSLQFCCAEENKNLVFVPAPGKNLFGRDHAESLAFQLAKITGGIYAPLLIRSGEKAQKLKSEKERKMETKLCLKPNAIEALRQYKNQASRIIFIDDIITSGATAKSAFETLGRPKNYMVWTIFHRPRLRRQL
ncbi:MAG: hypothetical protein A2Z20_01875 [Bdellovibrionales bacterium RBG_16_40_8]|nr:MAG: hypothetical protein A2Z20_01875 [Bdellovibrionales bacterium RBG_16_40_8]